MRRLLRKEYLVICFACYPLLLFSQEYCGKVYDGDHSRPLDAASVALLSADSLIITYAYTAEDGSFCLSGKAAHAPSFLSVSFIGYARKLISLNRFTKGMSINLEPIGVELKEVQVKAHRLYMTGDTLNYSVSGFKAPQDVTIADVMRRMPGIEVSESGGIKYQGVDIKKFYIEGLDLLDDKYKLASNNIRADYIKDVQILENHEPINTLRGKTFSEQAAVNLVLKDDAKQTWLAAFDLGAGASPFLWNNSMMGMAFKKNSQQLNLYKNDNTGRNLQQDVLSSVTDIVQLAEKKSIFGTTGQPVMSPVSYPAPPVEEKRSRFNKEHLVSTNHLYRLGENKEIKSTVAYLNNKEEYRNQTGWNYFYSAGSLLTYNEQIRQKTKENKLEASLTYEDNGKTYFLSDRLEGKGHFNSNHTQGEVGRKLFSEQYDLPSYQLNNEFRLIVPRTKHRMEFYSTTQFNSLPNELEIRSDDLYSFISGSPQQIFQQVSLRSYATDNQFVFTLLRKGWQMGQKARLVYLGQVMETKLKSQPAPVPEIKFDDNNRYNRLGVFYSPFLYYKKDRFSVQAILDFHYNHIRLSHHQNEDSPKDDCFYFLPSLNISYEPGDWSFKGKLNVTNDYFTWREPFSSWMFRNYKSIHSNEVIPATKNMNYSGSISYRNPVHSLFAGVNLGFRQRQSEQMPDVRLTEEIYTFTRMVQARNHTWSYYVSFSLSKSFNFWNSRLFFQSLHAVTQKKQLVNSVRNVYETASSSFSGRLYIQPSRWFNSEYEVNYYLGKLKMTAPAEKELPSSRYYKHSWVNYFFICKLVELGIDQELFDGNGGQKGAYFMDVTLSLKQKSKKLTFELRNLFDAHTYSHSTYQTHLQSETSYVLRGRCFLVRFSFNI